MIDVQVWMNGDLYAVPAFMWIIFSVSAMAGFGLGLCAMRMAVRIARCRTDHHHGQA